MCSWIMLMFVLINSWCLNFHQICFIWQQESVDAETVGGQSAERSDCQVLSPIWKNYNTPSKDQGMNLREKETERGGRSEEIRCTTEKVSSGHAMAMTVMISLQPCFSAWYLHRIRSTNVLLKWERDLQSPTQPRVTIYNLCLLGGVTFFSHLASYKLSLLPWMTYHTGSGK